MESVHLHLLVALYNTYLSTYTCTQTVVSWGTMVLLGQSNEVAVGWRDEALSTRRKETKR